MPVGRPTGSRNRNYPSVTLKQALVVPQKIQDEASGTSVGRLTLAELLDVSPASSKLRELVAASRLYGLTTGGINSEEFGLTALGDAATGADEVAQMGAWREAVLVVAPFRTFLEAFNTKKIPSASVFKEFLTRNADVDAERAAECMEHLLEDAETAGFLRPTKGGQYVELASTSRPQREAHIGSDPDYGNDYKEDEEEAEDGLEAIPEDGRDALVRQTPAIPPGERRPAGPPKKVFIAHGKNRTPLEQLKSALDTFKVDYAVAVDEPYKGRPISEKVASLMRDQCSSGVFIFTADEQFLRVVPGSPGETEELWRPSQNVIFELGAASILYENRIVIFKEKDVEFPSDFSDLGYIEFEKDQLVAELGNLFKELVALDILEVRAKG